MPQGVQVIALANPIVVMPVRTTWSEIKPIMTPGNAKCATKGLGDDHGEGGGEHLCREDQSGSLEGAQPTRVARST